MAVPIQLINAAAMLKPIGPSEQPLLLIAQTVLITNSTMAVNTIESPTISPAVISAMIECILFTSLSPSFSRSLLIFCCEQIIELAFKKAT